MLYFEYVSEPTHSPESPLLIQTRGMNGAMDPYAMYRKKYRVHPLRAAAVNIVRWIPAPGNNATVSSLCSSSACCVYLV